ncbi:hypothetical protein [Nocardia brasiliensis]|uniref:Secreted protein n=1 Tax=Nocardia brasiliensis (strain ATCC 700358 / HUJEG-1) TaxID=1133849 RepID=K0EKR8_NOCB7|nr:hypothetical protein [Nocardia brasiliensis]AFT98076.1 hypothetical protein O3I_000570 [Nocardia brasiliensis ATCC 700358]OCF90769.1 hypothetical protein AW168_07845 [Nocardia brasiliensis]
MTHWNHRVRFVPLLVGALLSGVLVVTPAAADPEEVNPKRLPGCLEEVNSIPESEGVLREKLLLRCLSEGCLHQVTGDGDNVSKFLKCTDDAVDQVDTSEQSRAAYKAAFQKARPCLEPLLSDIEVQVSGDREAELGPKAAYCLSEAVHG